MDLVALSLSGLMVSVATIFNIKALALSRHMYENTDFYEANPVGRFLLNKPKFILLSRLFIYPLVFGTTFFFDFVMPILGWGISILCLGVWSLDWLSDKLTVR